MTAAAIFAAALPATAALAPVSHTAAPSAYGNLPLAFERNEGQVDSSIDFLSRGRGYLLSCLFLGGNGDNEYALGLAVDGSGNAYVTGVTNSSNFPGVTEANTRRS